MKIIYYVVCLIFVLSIVGCSSDDFEPQPITYDNNTKNFTIIDSEEPEIVSGNWTIKNHTFKDFNNNTIIVQYNVSENYLDYYKNKSVDATREYKEFYPDFFNQPYGNETYNQIINTLQKKNETDRELLNKMIMFLASMEYNITEDFYYPYEVLDIQKGMCTDKNFVLVELIHRLDYGVALIDFPDNNHLAAGIKCKNPQYGEYCFVDATSKFTYITDNKRLYGNMNEELTSNYTVVPIYDGKIYNASKDYATVNKIYEKREQYVELIEEYLILEKQKDFLRPQFERCQYYNRMSEPILTVVAKQNKTMYDVWNITVQDDNTIVCGDIYDAYFTGNGLSDVLEQGMELEKWLDAPGRGVPEVDY